MKYFLMYLAAVSLVAAAITVSDKRRAQRHRRRIPEKVLFITALIGGSAAMFITMVSIRHKTRHKRFMIGLPLIMALQAAAIGLVIIYT